MGSCFESPRSRGGEVLAREYPAGYPGTFYLFFENGFTHPEIAAKTGLPLGTIKTRLRRGLIILREQLQRTGTPNNQSAS